MQCCWYYKGLPSKPSSVQLLSHTQSFEGSAGTERVKLRACVEPLCVDRGDPCTHRLLHSPCGRLEAVTPACYLSELCVSK